MIAGFLAFLRRDARAAMAIAYLALLVVVAFAAPWLSPYSPTAQNVNEMLQEPSAAHWMGTDDLGRDILSRLIHGAPATIYASFLAVAIAILLGVPVGLLPLAPDLGIHLGPLLQAALTGLLATLVFAIWPLAVARDVSPARLFRALADRQSSLAGCIVHLDEIRL